MRRIDEHKAQVFSCITAAEESLHGWLALLNRKKPGQEQLEAYAKLQRCLETLGKFSILPFDHDAADHFQRLQGERIPLGTMDLKLASICIAYDATLLSRNLVDFQKVPGLRVENWLD
jgi:tRNA(fMet)-specific endonuclease VapC